MDLERMSEEERNEVLVAAFQYIQSHPFLPLGVYLERLKALPTVHHECVEFAPSDSGNGWDILLDMRRPNDARYANRLGTQGSTVMRGDTLGKLFANHEENEASFVNPPCLDFRFCGLGVSPLLERGHEYVPVFGRILPRKPEMLQKADEDVRTWVPLDELHRAPVIPANKVYADMAINTMIYGFPPVYEEYLGTD